MYLPQKAARGRDKEIQMSIYKRVMGDQFYQLDPMLQKRYEFLGRRPFKGTGIMKTIEGGPK